jgi:hypothetical protein
MVLGVLTPVLYSDDLDAAKYDSLDENAVKLQMPEEKLRCFLVVLRR